MKEEILELLRQVSPANEESRIALEQVYSALATTGTVIEYHRGEDYGSSNIPTEDFELNNID